MTVHQPMVYQSKYGAVFVIKKDVNCCLTDENGQQK